MDGLPFHIRTLLKPAAYPFRTPSVKLVQTHISYVLITPGYAYKIKKPVDFGFLDFTTLIKRLHYCNEEVRLNRRLSKGIYLGVVPIVRDNKGYHIEGVGKPVEYAVKMRRIDEGNLLANRLKEGGADELLIINIAKRISAFHGKARTGKHIESFGTPAALGRNMDENFLQTGSFIGKTISKKRHEQLRDMTNKMLKSRRKEIVWRVKNGFVRDCHGDLHAEHIAIGPKGSINIIDCIEFCEKFRYSDIALDAAFLAMDLDYLGRPDLARAFEASCQRASSDPLSNELMLLYKSYRAVVRAKVASFRLAEAELTDAERSDSYIDSLRHFHLAGQYLSGRKIPLVIAMRGLSGSGKSFYANALAKAFDMIVISSDAVRKTLAGVKPKQHAYARFKGGIYSPEFTDKTYAAMNRLCAQLTDKGVPVVLDATFVDLKRLKSAKAAAEKAGGRFHVVQCEASERAIKERIKKRDAHEGTVSDARFDVYLEQKKYFRPPPKGTIMLTAGSGASANLCAAARAVFYNG